MPTTVGTSYTYGTSTSSNNNGRLITMTDGLGQEDYTYDALGRRTQAVKKVYNVNYTTAYTFNLAGEVVNMTYPSGRVVKHEYDAIGRVQNVKNNSTSATYAGSATYNTANQLTGFSYGNSVAASFGYSAARLQLASAAYAQGSANLVSLSYNYDQDSGSGVKNNGQIAGITDNVSSGRSATYRYDARKRLATAGTSGSTPYPQWGLSWTYDDYGNRTAQSVTAGSAPTNSVTVSTSTNRITAMGGYTFYYDSNGNLTQDDLYKFKYDAENRLVEVKNLSDTLIATYAFDGNSLRTIKVVGADRTWYLYDGTQLISEFEDAASSSYSSGTNPGSAGSDSTATLLFQHGDHLTTRLTTDQQGNVSNEQAHYPYGESWYATGTADPSVEWKFASYLKDSEVATGRLSYAVSSEHSARVARFLTPDSVAGDGTEGTALNGYAYSSGDPIRGPDQPPPPPIYANIGAVLGCNYGMTDCGRKWPQERERRDRDPCDWNMEVENPEGVFCDGVTVHFSEMRLRKRGGGPPVVPPDSGLTISIKPEGGITIIQTFLGSDTDHLTSTAWFKVDVFANLPKLHWFAAWNCGGRYYTKVHSDLLPCTF